MSEGLYYYLGGTTTQLLLLQFCASLDEEDSALLCPQLWTIFPHKTGPSDLPTLAPRSWSDYLQLL